MTLYRLKGASGPVINQSWALRETTVIGRSAECDVAVEDAALAARHALIEIADGGVTIHLLDAGGGLFLNGRPVERAELSSGDEIRIAGCRWLLQAPGLKPARVLTEEATRPRRAYLPWLIAGGLVAAGALAWYLGYLPF